MKIKKVKQKKMKMKKINEMNNQNIIFKEINLSPFISKIFNFYKIYIML